MKTAISLFLSLLVFTAQAQTESFNELLVSAKTLFKAERNLNQVDLDSFDYDEIVSLLEKAIELNPESSEARYFLGYCYSRINMRDGRGMTDMSLGLLYKTSEQFEIINQMEPSYSGEIVVLDPYSKLTSEWGSMALSYWYKNKLDSAKWAFKEGKKRGGFPKYVLELNKKVLDACSPNAILISSGDNSTFPLWYLQFVEKYRTDVSVVDISLLSTRWYPSFLTKRYSIAFDLPSEVLDTMEYIRWNDSAITINNFTWTVKPSFYDRYIVRGDRVFLSLLKENNFQRDVHFTKGFIPSQTLSLTEHLTNYVFIDKLEVPGPQEVDFNTFYEGMTVALKLCEEINLNSQDELKRVDFFRYSIFIKVHQLLLAYEKEKAKSLMDLMNKYAPETIYPYHTENGKQYADYLHEKLQSLTDKE